MFGKSLSFETRNACRFKLSRFRIKEQRREHVAWKYRYLRQQFNPFPRLTGSQPFQNSAALFRRVALLADSPHTRSAPCGPHRLLPSALFSGSLSLGPTAILPLSPRWPNAISPTARRTVKTAVAHCSKSESKKKLEESEVIQNIRKLRILIQHQKPFSTFKFFFRLCARS